MGKEQTITEAKKRFYTILEYQNWLNEDEGEAPEGENMEMPETGMEGEGGMDPNAMGPEGMGAQEQPMDGNMGEESNGVPEFQPEGGEDGMPGAEDMGQMPEDDVEEIDVEDLTDSQEETEKKVGKVSKKIAGLDDKLSKVMGLIDKFTADIDANNAKIEDLKAEFEKRNPTNIEKMTLRSKRAYPFGETPEEYWEKKEAEGYYSTEDDQNGVNDEKYKITKSDVDNITNWKQIYDSISNEDYNQTLTSILGY